MSLLPPFTHKLLTFYGMRKHLDLCMRLSPMHYFIRFSDEFLPSDYHQ